ncbi:MAG: hypothetical protein M0P01_05465 [Treponema sp.]|nr:hypothetical protein [Treponema sp.]
MGRIYHFLGIRTSVIYAGMNTAERKNSYSCGITYGTNSEFAFDYLWDNMQYSVGNINTVTFCNRQRMGRPSGITRFTKRRCLFTNLCTEKSGCRIQDRCF